MYFTSLWPVTFCKMFIMLSTFVWNINIILVHRGYPTHVMPVGSPERKTQKIYRQSKVKKLFSGFPKGINIIPDPLFSRANNTSWHMCNLGLKWLSSGQIVHATQNENEFYIETVSLIYPGNWSAASGWYSKYACHGILIFNPILQDFKFLSDSHASTENIYF